MNNEEPPECVCPVYNVMTPRHKNSGLWPVFPVAAIENPVAAIEISIAAIVFSVGALA